MKKACKGGIYPKSSSVSSRLGSYGKKMKSGGSLGMKSVKAGYDKNPGVTRADIIVAAKGEAKSGTKMMKKAQTGTKMSNLKNVGKKETGLKSAFENVAQRKKSLKTIGSKIAKPMGKAQVGKALKKYQDWQKEIQSDKQYTKSSFRTADSLRFAKPKATSLEGRLKERKANIAKADSIERAVEKRIGVPRKSNMYEKRTGGKMSKKCRYGCK